MKITQTALHGVAVLESALFADRCGAFARPHDGRPRSARRVVGLVRFGGQPGVVPDAVMVALLQREDPTCGLHGDCRPLVRAGEPINLVDGPLTGMEGIFAQQDGKNA